MERIRNELSLTYLLHGQSALMTKCVAGQILGKLLEIISIYLEIYSLDIEPILEAELNEQMHVCTMPFKGSKERQLIELNEYRSLII